MPRRSRKWLLPALATALVPVPLSAQGQAGTQVDPRRELGLMGTVPIYWGEAGDVAEVLAGGAERHWARARLESRFRLVPLDRLDVPFSASLSLLMLSQPRSLSPAENVALDAFVRGGGRVLLLADPMMTGESRFPIGDRRRPQDVALLSPILRHWGLDLQFDDAQPGDVELREFAGTPLPTRLSGRFAEPATASGCALDAGGAAAICAIGAGQVIVVADAAVVDLHHPHPQAAAALDALVTRAFDPAREITGPVLKSAEIRDFQHVPAPPSAAQPGDPPPLTPGGGD